MNTQAQKNAQVFKRGIINGVPICLGYLAVGFTLGIIAAQAGMTPFQASLASALVVASAGQYAGFTMVASGGTYAAMAAVIFIANMRYMLMSASLSQRLDRKFPFFHRFFVAYGITDEIFGVAIGSEGAVNPFYNYGLMAISIPGWTLGAGLGVVLGNVLPVSLVSALSVGLYGMFIAIIIPPARKDKIVAVLIIISMVASFLCTKLPFVSNLSEGNRTIILTVIIAGLAAVIKPVSEDKLNGS